ncbi:MAG: hypothetical protein WAO52_02415 [Prolixibacteraceae bacterium]
MKIIYLEHRGMTGTIPTVRLLAISGVTTVDVTFLATVDSDGGTSVLARGCEYYKYADCSDQPITAGAAPGTGLYGGAIGVLQPGTTYYARAFATNAIGKAVSNLISFTTEGTAQLPIVSINSITGIYADRANGHATIESTGGATLSVSGICWSTSPNPTTLNNHTTNGIKTAGSFTSVMQPLLPDTTYYVRAYATNEVGTAYSVAQSFVTDIWYKILEFQTNSSQNDTFYPIVYGSGSFFWDLGDGTFTQGNYAYHVYADSTIKTVRLLSSLPTPYLTKLYFVGCRIVGQLDLSHHAVKTVSNFTLSSNREMTGVMLPSVLESTVTIFDVAYCNISGTLDLSPIRNISKALFDFNDTWIEDLVFGTVSGTLSTFMIRGAYVQTVDLSMFTLDSIVCISVAYMPNLQSVIFPVCSNVFFGGTNYFTRCPQLSSLNITALPDSANANNVKLSMADNNWTTSEVNKMLYDLDSIVSSGFTGRYLWIDGSNAAPDNASGGYNGTAAVASLNTKGMYVQNN